MTGSVQGTREMKLTDKIINYFHAVKTDFPASLEMLAEDVQWINRLPAHIPFGGEYQGRDGVVQYFQQMAKSFIIGEHPLDDFDFIETSDTVVIVGYEKDGKSLTTGKVFDLEFVWVVRFDSDGRICYLREHNDTAAIGAAFLP